MKGIKAFKKINNTTFETGGIGGSKKTIWKIGETKKVNGEISLCGCGFHFYKSKNFIFGIGLFGPNTCFCEIEALGNIKSDTEKCVTNEIKILKYISIKDWKKQLNNKNNSGNRNSGNGNSGNGNSGRYNSGYCNSGNCNSGDRNSGCYNSGDYNSGYYNSGYCNSGNGNSGYCNSGNGNSGRYNSGNRNSGDYNSGDYNSGNCNSGGGYINYFCEKTKYFLFDIEVDEIPNQIKYLNMSWFNLQNKTYKEAWAKCPKNILKTIKSIDVIMENKEKFFHITGIQL